MIPGKITVLFSDGVEARMKLFAGAREADSTRMSSGNQALTASASLRTVILNLASRHFKMRHHAERMNPRVRAAGTVDNRPAGK